MKPTYLEGVIHCEKLYESGSTFTELYTYIELEERIGGYKWVNWVDGFTDGIKHFKELESINQLKEMNNENI